MIRSVRVVRSRVTVAAGAAIALTALAGCAGNVGSAGGSESTGTGFEFGAPQEEVNEVISDFDPVTIKFQPAAASASAPGNEIAIEFKEKIEERSNGQISVEIVWNHAIASVDETEDALADGRIDISHAVPIYKPDEFPGINELSNILGAVGGSPMQDELVANAVASELAWNTPEVLSAYDEAGLVPLVPAYGGGYYSMCAEPGSSEDDWQGRQFRIASNAQSSQAEAIGTVPTSLEYTELYEAMQRGTVDCTAMQLNTAAIAGLFEVAPNIAYASDVSFTRALSATLGGANFSKLPLAYQQIVFDHSVDDYAVTMQDFFATGSEGIAQAKEFGGTVEEFDEATEAALAESNQEIAAAVASDGSLGSDIESRLTESIERWQGEVSDLGLEDGGTLADFDEWYEGSADDYRELGQKVFDAGALEHRPS